MTTQVQQNNRPEHTPLSKGTAARERILQCALELFAAQGFDKTSTRLIAQKANVNLSSIKYYFEDKEGLYKAAYMEPLGTTPKKDIALFCDAKTLHEALFGIFTGFIEPLKLGPKVELCVRLHMREMVEGGGAFEHMIENEMTPYYRALISVIAPYAPHIKKQDLERLCFCIMSMGIFLYTGSRFIQSVNPTLTSNTKNLHVWRDQMIQYAISMVNSHSTQSKPPVANGKGKETVSPRKTRTKQHATA